MCKGMYDSWLGRVAEGNVEVQAGIFIARLTAAVLRVFSTRLDMNLLASNSHQGIRCTRRSGHAKLWQEISFQEND
jgi:hypothetical protein